MKIFTKMAAVVLACVLAVPGEARVNVVYQQQDCLRIVGLLQQARAMKNGYWAQARGPICQSRWGWCSSLAR